MIRCQPTLCRASALGQAKRLDPILDVGLSTAGQVLSTNDPGAPQTMDLVKRIILAGPVWPGGGKSEIRRISDLNPTLEKIVYVRENSWVIPAGVVALLGLTFALGRLSVRGR